MSASQRPAWLAVLLNRRMLICIATGFTSGLPLYLLLNLVPAWLKTEGLSLKLIGAMALIQFPYTWKFLWSPLLDRFALPVLGRRRSWMLLTQIVLLLAIAGLGQISVTGLVQQSGTAMIEARDWWDHLAMFAPLFALTGVIAFFSATQDIVLDAFRRELLPDVELGLGNAFHVNAYRIAGLIPGSVSLILADHLPWDRVFLITALFMLPGILTTLLVSEPARATPPRRLREAVVEPFHEFFSRHGARAALLILVFIFFYKLGDSLCTSLATPFYIAMGFTKTQIGWVAKNAGLWPSVIGGILGGLWMVRLGINRALWIFGAFQLFAIFGFAELAWLGAAEPTPQRLTILALVIGIEAVGVGLGTTAFVAYMARTTHPMYTATQLALFTSLMALPRTVVNASAGWLVDGLGWFHFFLLCALLAVPGMLLLFKVAPWSAPVNEEDR